MKRKNPNQKIMMAGLVIVGLLLLFNTYRISAMQSQLQGSTESESVIPTGVPKTYGGELSVSYDDVSPYNPQSADAAIAKLANLDRTITLEGADLDRYINALYKLEGGISCEYCCGARSIISENGQPACGCAHSYAMRGLAKYLITQHGDEYTDEEILGEVAKWKALFFPNQLTQKAAILESQGVEANYVNLGSNKYRGIEKGASGGGMVGGC